MRVLVLSGSHLANVVQMLPAFTDAQNAHPHVVFDVVVDERWSDLVHWHRAVGQVFTLPIKRWRRGVLDLLSSDHSRRLRRQIHKYSYDWVIDLHGGWLFAAFARSLHCASAGFAQVNGKRCTYAYLYNYRQSHEAHVNRVEEIRHLFGHCLAYRPKKSPCYGLARDRFCVHEPSENLCLMLGARDPAMRLPQAQAVALVQHLQGLGYAVRLLWRDRGSGDYLKAVADASGAELLPRLKLSGIAAVLVESKAVVSVDNGLSYLAAALQVPMVRLQKAEAHSEDLAYGGLQRALVARQGTWPVTSISDTLSELLSSSQGLRNLPPIANGRTDGLAVAQL